MKKNILLALVTLILLFSIVFTGCAADGVAQEKYDQVVAQLADAQSALTQAQNNLSTLQSQKSAVDSDLQAAQAQITDLQQQVADLQQQVAKYEYTGLTKSQIAEKIVQNYQASHLYEEDVYDCNNMASDVWNMLKAQGINAVIVVGSIEHLITDILQSDHAWVLAEVAPGEQLALDPTVGQTFTRTANSRYFRGWSFATPADLKANDDLKLEYNVRVSFINTLGTAVNEAINLYNSSSTQAEADKWWALYIKLKELKTAQETLATSLMNQINQLATPLS